MKLPIRNRSSRALTLFIEPWCEEYDVPVGGEAIVHLEDGRPHAIDVTDDVIAIWNEGGSDFLVEVITPEQNLVIEALQFAHVWLGQAGAEGMTARQHIDDALAGFGAIEGHVASHFAVWRAFRDGYRLKEAETSPIDAALPVWRGLCALAGAYRAGGVAAWFNRRVRISPWLIELGQPPFDTETARAKFDAADAQVRTR